MYRKRIFSILIAVGLSLLFNACGGGDEPDPAPQIQPSAQGDDLQKILAKMNQDANAFMGKALSKMGEGENPEDEMGFLGALLTQRYNEWRITSDRLCTGSTAPIDDSTGTKITAGNGLTRQQCEDKFWHFVLNQKGKEIISSLSQANPILQLKAIETALQIFKGLNIQPPQDYLNQVGSTIANLKSGLGSGSGTDLASLLSGASGSQLSSLLSGANGSQLASLLSGANGSQLSSLLSGSSGAGSQLSSLLSQASGSSVSNLLSKLGSLGGTSPVGDPPFGQLGKGVKASPKLADEIVLLPLKP